MINGMVTADREIVVPLESLGAGQSTTSIRAVVDTGFNGFLTLPIDSLNALGSSAVGTRRAELGDGSLVDLDVHVVRIKWHEERNVLALLTETTPLVGMSLLWNSRVSFDTQEGGAVTIESTP